MTDVTIAGDTFSVSMDGDASRPVVVLSHPLGASAAIWDGVAPALARHFRVLRYDARGHGGSTRAGAPYSIGRLGADVLAILDAHDIAQASFIGTSLGGAVGQWLLIHAPHRITRAVLANTAARFGEAKLWNGRIATAKRDGMAGLAETTMTRWFSDAFAASEAAEPVRAILRATDPEGYAGSCAALRDVDLSADVARVACPVLVFAGRHDPSVPPERTAELARTIPGAKLIEMDARHMPAAEDPAGFAKAALAFLTATGRPVRRAAARPASAGPRAKPAPTRGRAAAPATKRTAAATRAARTPATGKAAIVARDTPAPKRGVVRAAPVVAKTAAPKTARATSRSAVAQVAAGKAVTSRPAAAKARTPSKAAATKAAPAKSGTIARGMTKAALGKATPGKATPGKATPGKAAPAKAVSARAASARTIGAKVSPAKGARTAKAAPAKAAPTRAAPIKAASAKSASEKTASAKATSARTAPRKAAIEKATAAKMPARAPTAERTRPSADRAARAGKAGTRQSDRRRRGR